jgi:uncharacterized protein
MTQAIEKIAVISALAEKVPQLGRTSLMKHCYFLQVLRKVPLGYRFSLYSYGPFDSDVLADLDSAAAIGAVTSSVVSYFNTYGYRIEPGPRAPAIQSRSTSFLESNKSHIDWVAQTFGHMNASELELVSTIIYSDREAKSHREKVTIDELARRVRDVKPHFNLEEISRSATVLNDAGLLEACD